MGESSRYGRILWHLVNNSMVDYLYRVSGNQRVITARKGGGSSPSNNNKNKKMEDGGSPDKKVASSSTLMESLLGLLRIRVKRGVNLAVRDISSSDPYVVVKMGRQKLKTRVIKKDVNPEWNEDLTLSVTDPNLPVKLTVYDHDTFSKDDKMGDADIDVKPYIEALKMNLANFPSGTIITRIQPSRANCLAEETCITYADGKVTQDLCLRLRNVECGEVEIQLQWIDLPGSKGLL